MLYSTVFYLGDALCGIESHLYNFGQTPGCLAEDVTDPMISIPLQKNLCADNTRAYNKLYFMWYGVQTIQFMLCTNSLIGLIT